MTTTWLKIALTGCFVMSSQPSPALGAVPADTVYQHGYVYTGEPGRKSEQAVAVRDGRFVFVGSDRGVQPYIGRRTHVHDLQGRMLMPGLIDGHLHALAGGTQLHQCNLNYRSLTVQELLAAMQKCLDATQGQEPDGWLEVSNWFQQAMRPAGVIVVAADLDMLQTRRPIVVNTSFGHTLLLNKRAIASAGITEKTADPPGGAVGRDANGKPNGLLEDDARDLIAPLLRKPTPADDIAALELALASFAKQGITTLVDADSSAETIAAFDAVSRAAQLTARAYLIPQIPVAVAAHPDERLAEIAAIAERHAQGALAITPDVRVRSAKIYLDGVIAGPSFTGAMLAPYLIDAGAHATPRWVSGPNRGPEPYFSPSELKRIVLKLARYGLDPHMHVDGDRAVHAGLDAIQALRRDGPHPEIRPALAHDEIVDPTDFSRFKALGVIPVLSLQWEKPANDTIDNLRNYLGPERMRVLEPAGFLARAGARIVYGSDWPVDPLNEWFALKVGITREAAPDAGVAYAGRLGGDPGLSVSEALRAITLNAAYEVHAEADLGSIRPGKLADFLVLDRNVLKIPPAEIANVVVLETTVGGRVVYSASDARTHSAEVMNH